MELVKALNQAAFTEIEEGFCGGAYEAKTAEGRTRHILLDTFINTIRSVAEDNRLADANPEASKALSIRHLMLVFHQIDYKDRKYITWDEFTMFLIDDAKKGSKGSDGGDTGRMDRFQECSAVRQDPVGRIRYIRYIPEWERVLRLTSFNEEHTVEIAKVLGNKSFEVTKVSKSTPTSATAAEAITDHNVVVTTNSDISCSFYTTQSSLDEVSATALIHQRNVAMDELHESQVSMLWHRGLPEKRFFTGSRSGALIPWNLHMERNVVSERYKPCMDLKWQVFGEKNKQAITCMMPWENKIICGSMASTRNIAVLDVERQIAMAPCGKAEPAPETLRADEIKEGHKLGVLALARNDYSDVIVSAGFERVPFVWVLKLQNFQPWKLQDKHDPHRGDINGLFSPANTPQIISSDTRGVIKVWDIRTFHCVQTLYCDKRKPDRPETEMEAKLFYSSVTYNPHGGSLLACGPHHTTVFRGDVPKYLRCADDSPVTACLYNVATRNFVTAHGRSVKVWEEENGSVVANYENITESTITCLALDHRGRKFFLGDSRGNIQGHVFATGICYRRFKSLSSAVADLSYAVFRSGKRFLLICGGSEFWACEDTEVDGKQTKVTQPFHLMRAELMKQHPDHNVATPPIRTRRERHRSTVAGSLTSTAANNPSSTTAQQQQQQQQQANTLGIAFSKVCSQSKLSMAFLTANSLVAGIDIGTLTVIHLFSVQTPVACVTPMGDLPVVAILDQNWNLYIFAIRPSLSAEKLLVTKPLLDEEQLLLDPADRSVPSCMTFHQNKRRLYVGDSAGTVSCWDLADFVKSSGLGPASYPMTSIAETVLRKRHELPDQTKARESIYLLRKVEAHTDEVNTIEVVFTNVAVTVVTSSFDHRVRAWDWEFNDLGDLSQGRVPEPDKAVDIRALHAHYARNRIKQFVFTGAEPEDDELCLTDFSDLVLRLLRRSIHRYKARKERAARAAMLSGTTVQDQMRQKRKKSLAAAGKKAVIKVRIVETTPEKDAEEEKEKEKQAKSRSPESRALVRPLGEEATLAESNGADSDASPRTLLERSRSAKPTTAEGAKKQWDVLTKVELGEQHVKITKVEVDECEQDFDPTISQVFDEQRRRTLVNKHRRSMKFGTVLGYESGRSFRGVGSNALSSAGFTNVHSAAYDQHQPYGAPEGDGRTPAPPPARRTSNQRPHREDLPLTMSTLYEDKIKAEQKREADVAKKCNVNLECLTTMRKTMSKLEDQVDVATGEVLHDNESRKRANHYDHASPTIPKLPQINLARAQEQRTLREAADDASRRLFDITQQSSKGVPAPQTARALMPSKMDSLRSPSSSMGTMGAGALTARTERAKKHDSLPASKSKGYSSSIYNSSHSISFWASQ